VIWHVTLAAPPDVLPLTNRDNVADHARLIMASFKYQPLGASKLLVCGNRKEQL